MAIKRPLYFLAVLVLFLSFTACKPACPISSCKVRMVHAHGEGEFRGQPFYKKQNPKIGEKIKVQKEQ